MSESKSALGLQSVRPSASTVMVGIACFAVGLVTASVFFYGSTAALWQRKLIDDVPESLREMMPDSLKSAKYTAVGGFVFVTSKEYPFDAICYPQSKTHRPAVFFSSDGDQDTVGTVSIHGKDGRHLVATDEDGDGTLDSYAYVTSLGLDSVQFVDSDMDGHYDHRMGPERDYAVRIDGQWLDFIRDEGKSCVEIDGEIRELEQVNNMAHLRFRVDTNTTTSPH